MLAPLWVGLFPCFLIKNLRSSALLVCEELLTSPSLPYSSAHSLLLVTMTAVDSSMWLSAGNDADVYIYAPLMDRRLEATDEADFLPIHSLNFGNDSMVFDQMLSISLAQPASAPWTADGNAMVLYDSTQAVDAPRTADSNAMVLYDSTQAVDAGKTADSDAVILRDSIEIGKTICPKCGVSMVKRVLKRHMRQKHSDTGSSLYKCHECGKSFQRRDNWKRHLLEQHGDKSGEVGTVECMACGKVVRARYFKDHSSRKSCVAAQSRRASPTEKDVDISGRFLPETILDPFEITFQLCGELEHRSSHKYGWNDSWLPHWVWEMRGLVLRTLRVSGRGDVLAGAALLMAMLDLWIGQLRSALVHFHAVLAMVRNNLGPYMSWCDSMTSLRLIMMVGMMLEDIERHCWWMKAVDRGPGDLWRWCGQECREMDARVPLRVRNLVGAIETIYSHRQQGIC